MRVRMLEEVKDRSGSGAKGPWAFYYQAGLAKMGHEVRQVWIEVQKDASKRPVYVPPGDYEFTPDLRVNEYGEFALARTYTLEAVKTPAGAPAKVA